MCRMQVRRKIRRRRRTVRSRHRRWGISSDGIPLRRRLQVTRRLVTRSTRRLLLQRHGSIVHWCCLCITLVLLLTVEFPQPFGFTIDLPSLFARFALFVFEHAFDAFGFGVFGFAAGALFAFLRGAEAGGFDVEFPLRTGVCWGWAGGGGVVGLGCGCGCGWEG